MDVSTVQASTRSGDILPPQTRVNSLASGSAEASRLRELLALHEAALECMAHGLCMVDAEQRLTLYNRRFIEIFNLLPEAVRSGMPIAELMHHSAMRGNFPLAQLDEVMRCRSELMARGAPFRHERRMQDGRVFNMNYRPLADGGWVTLVEDVTEFKRRENDLRVQFERFEQAVNHMSHGLCAVDSEHRIVLFNRLFLEMYDLPPEVIRVGVSMRDAIDYAAGRGYFPKASAERVWQRRLEKMALRKPFQQYQNLSNGHEYILHYHPMDDGGWVTLCEDVTERHRMERELRLQFERFDQAISHMQHGLCLFDPDERLIVCNQRYLDIYGLDPAVIKPGVTHRELLAHWVASGNEPGMSAEAFYEKRKAVVTARAVSTMLLHLANGRVDRGNVAPDAGRRLGFGA